MASEVPAFLSIGPRTSLWTPLTPSPGELLVMCSWLGAGRKHIAKYQTLYNRVAPNARILLIESDVSTMVKSYEYQRRQVQSAVSAVMDVLAECDDAVSNRSGNSFGYYTDSAVSLPIAPSTAIKPKIMLHLFSNGGTNTATQLLIALRERRAAPTPLIGILFDSCPSKGKYWKTYSAMTESLPKGIASQVVGAFAVHVVLCMVYTGIAFGKENPATMWRRTVLDVDTVGTQADNEHDSFCWNPAEMEDKTSQLTNAEGRKRRASYLYSEADKMVDPSDITEHANDARNLGWDVEELAFEGTGHCAHFIGNEDRYAEAMASLWESPDAARKKIRREARL